MANVDVAIVGGGPAGAALALRLCDSGYSTAIIERTDYNGVRIGETFPPGVQPLFASLGVWERFIAQNHSPSFATRSAWGASDIYHNDFVFNPYGSGWHVDRARFDRMLASAAEQAGALVFQRTNLLSFERQRGKWSLRVDNGVAAIRSRFLVDATGRRSSLARALGARRIALDRLIGVYFLLASNRAEPTTTSYALIESATDGWWYSAALPDGKLALAYMSDADLYAKHRLNLMNGYREALRKTKHTKLRVQDYRMTDSPIIITANSSRLDVIANHDWLAVGDAAIAFDPLSGQGVYKAIQSAINAATAINKHFAGDSGALPDYATFQEGDFARYLETHRKVYSREKRWADSPFWSRRQSSVK